MTSLEVRKTIVALILIAPLSGCAALNGPTQSVDDHGPVQKASDISKTDPLFEIFRQTHDAARGAGAGGAANNGNLAMTMFKAGADYIDQNCDDFFISNGQTETYLLFGKDVTLFVGAVATTAETAAKASSGTIGGTAIGTTALVGANDLYRKQLTGGADFTASARTMVKNTLSAFETTVEAKKTDGYTYGLAIRDLRDLQELCTPPAIAVNMAAAISKHQFSAITVQAPATTLPSTTSGAAVSGGTITSTQATTTPATQPSADAQAKATTIKQALFDLQAHGLKLSPDLLNGLDTIASGQAVPPPPAAQGVVAIPASNQVPADARIQITP